LIPLATQEVYDYVIVGGGSAGCVLASRLSEDRGSSVLVLEAGVRDVNLVFRIPMATMNIGGKYDWMYPTEPDPSRGGKSEAWAAGKVLGGGSSVNAMFWARGNPGDFDGWSQLGCEGWSYADVLPYFKKAETFDGGADEYRGGVGPQSVSRLRVSHQTTDLFVKSAEAAGHMFNADYNGRSQEGVAYSQYSQKNGLRANTASSYLARAQFRGNLKVRTRSEARQVLFDGKRAVGVEYQHGDRVSQATARREVVLSTGSYASPKLLMLSGIGPADELRKHGIEILVDRPEVGRNLQEHPYTAMMFEVNVPTLNLDMRPTMMVKHGLNFVFRRRGPVTSGGVHSVVFGRVSSESALPDYELLFAPFSVASDPDTHDVHEMNLSPVPSVMVTPSVCHPHSRGAVTLRSADPADKPVIELKVMGDARDVATLTAACRTVRAIFGSDPLKPHVERELVPGDAVNTEEEFEAFLRGASFIGNHPVATCRMGGDDASVVDPALRVRGVEGLRVIDASVIPTLISGHTNAPTIMLAEKGAALIRSESATRPD
jgi:choline dehydrogenase